MRVLAVRDRGAGPSASHKINVLTKIDSGSSLVNIKSLHFNCGIMTCSRSFVITTCRSTFWSVSFSWAFGTCCWRGHRFCWSWHSLVELPGCGVFGSAGSGVPAAARVGARFRLPTSGCMQVWSLIQFYSVDFSKSRIGEKKCIFNKLTIKLCVSCCWQCPGTSAHRAAGAPDVVLVSL